MCGPARRETQRGLPKSVVGTGSIRRGPRFSRLPIYRLVAQGRNPWAGLPKVVEWPFIFEGVHTGWSIFNFEGLEIRQLSVKVLGGITGL